MSRRVASRLALAALGPLVLAGCGESPGYDAAPVEAYLASSQAEAFGPSAKVGRASCPGGLPLEEGMSFTCRLDVSGSEVPYRVRLTGVHGDQVSVSAAPAGVVISASEVDKIVQGSLGKGSRGAKVDCGGAFVVGEVGDTLPCTLVLGSQEKPLEVTVQDKAGRLSIGS